MPQTIDVTQKITGVTVQWVDSRGNPAPVDGAPTWESSDPALAIVNMGDGSVELVSADNVAGPVAVAIRATVDADLGEGVVTVEANEVVTVVPAMASTGTINLGTVVPK